MSGVNGYGFKRPRCLEDLWNTRDGCEVLDGLFTRAVAGCLVGLLVVAAASRSTKGAAGMSLPRR